MDLSFAVWPWGNINFLDLSFLLCKKMADEMNLGLEDVRTTSCSATLGFHKLDLQIPLCRGREVNENHLSVLSRHTIGIRQASPECVKKPPKGEGS